jgi:hypothetical protein
MKRKAEEEKEDNTVFFKAKDKSIAVFDATDLLVESLVLKELSRSYEIDERKEHPLPIDLETSRDVYRGLTLLLMFRMPRNLLVQDVESLDKSVVLAYNLAVSTGVFVNMCISIENLCKSLPDSCTEDAVLSLLSIWTRLVDPMCIENKGLNRGMTHDFKAVQKAIDRLQEKSPGISCDAALLSGYHTSPSSFVCRVADDSDAAAARNTLLNPNLWSQNVSQITFCGPWVSRLVSGGKGRLLRHDTLLAFVPMASTFLETARKVVDWAHDDSLIEFGSEHGMRFLSKGSADIHVIIDDGDKLTKYLKIVLAHDECYIRFGTDDVQICQSLACVSSHRKGVVTHASGGGDTLALEARGCVVFDRSLRRLNADKMKKISPVYSLLFEPDTEPARSLPDEVAFSGSTTKCLTPKQVRESLNGCTNAIDSWPVLRKFLFKESGRYFKSDVEACFE